jgi:HD-like signal output (HDOD) protein
VSANAQATAISFIERLAQDLNDKQLELPAFPDSVIRVQQAVRDPDIDAEDIVDILSSDPALAVRLLQLANSAAMRSSGDDVSDVRTAILRLGFKLVSSVAVSFAMRQLQRNESYSAEDRTRLEAIWNRSMEVAAACQVIAKNFTKVRADEALLTGLLHLLGHLYVFMRAQEAVDLSREELDRISEDWHTAIAKAIAETWGLSEDLATAMEQQEDYDVKFTGPVTLTEILLCAKVLVQVQSGELPAAPSAAACPSLGRVGLVTDTETPVLFEQYEDEIKLVKEALQG